MSRLIDVDKAENDIVGNVTTKAVSRVVAILQGQPTVDAIPIEWIKKHYGWLTMAGEMIEGWVKENEKSGNSD